jgi:hypothetical protein
VQARGLTHFVLARRDGGHYWMMNPDGADDEQHDDIFPNYINSFNSKLIGGVNYVYAGICVWIAPSKTPWLFNL